MSGIVIGILNKMKLPPGGWHFEAHGQKFRAGTEDQLKVQITEFRIRNNIPPGDVNQEINDYYCEKWPDACFKDYRHERQPAVGEPLGQRVVRWATAMWHGRPKGGHKLVSQDEANRRASICLSCPMNRAWQAGCSSCMGNVNSVLSQIRNLRSNKHAGHILSCSFMGWDNNTAVHIESLSLTPDQLSRKPPNCWLR